MLVLFGALLLPLALPARGQSAGGKAKNLPEGEGKEIVKRVCQQCHGLGVFTSLKFTVDGWRPVVAEMVSNGAPLQDEEVETVAQYLANNFGPESASAGLKEATDASSHPKIHVNQSTAKGLETALGLSEKEAEAIVGYREKHGDFKSWEDLKTVAGLDTKKIEEAKDRLVF